MIHPLSSLTTMSSHSVLKPRRLYTQSPNPNPKPSSSPSSSCNHSPSATLDLIILILVFFSCTFLITSSFAHIIRSVSFFLPLISISDPLPFLAGFLVFLAAFIAALEIACYRACIWTRRCENPRCRGLRKATEFDVQIQTEECIRFISSVSGSASAAAVAWKEIDELPWKGGKQGNNPDYECLRAELRRMAPPNGRAVLLFRARCGCPLAKLEAWSQKRGRRHKKKGIGIQERHRHPRNAAGRKKVRRTAFVSGSHEPRETNRGGLFSACEEGGCSVSSAEFDLFIDKNRGVQFHLRHSRPNKGEMTVLSSVLQTEQEIVGCTSSDSTKAAEQERNFLCP